MAAGAGQLLRDGGTLSRTLEFLASHEGEMVDDLRWLVEMESPSVDKALLDRVADSIARYASDNLGGVARVIDEKRGGNIVRVESGGDEGPPILILAHFDTVWPRGTIDTIPFRLDGGRAYGPGVFDMKGGLVQGLWALRAVRELGSSRRPVVLLCNADEEISSPNSRTLIEAEAKKAKAVLVLEPSKDGNLKTSRKGAGVFVVKVTGKAAHAGLDPTKGVSATEELSRLVLDLHSMTDMEKGTTVNVGVIHGGTRPNVVAQEALAEVDVRVPSKSEADRVVPLILGMKPHNPKAVLEVHGEIDHPPMERTEGGGALFKLAQRFAADMGWKLDECSVGGASDGNFCAALGVPTLDGLGAVGAGAHATDEHVVVGEMPTRAALLAELIQGI